MYINFGTVNFKLLKLKYNIYSHSPLNTHACSYCNYTHAVTMSEKYVYKLMAHFHRLTLSYLSVPLIHGGNNLGS